MCRYVDGVDRTMSRYRRVAAQAAIERHAVKQDETPHVGAVHEVPDRRQLIGLPVFVIPVPAWRRQDWAMPQQPPTRRPA